MGRVYRSVLIRGTLPDKRAQPGALARNPCPESRIRDSIRQGMAESGPAESAVVCATLPWRPAETGSGFC